MQIRKIGRTANRVTKYRGPIYLLKYPGNLDLVQEMFDWNGLGYKISTRGDTSGFTLRLLGDIPQWFQEALTESGVRIKKTKERGPIIDL